MDAKMRAVAEKLYDLAEGPGPAVYRAEIVGQMVEWLRSCGVSEKYLDLLISEPEETGDGMNELLYQWGYHLVSMAMSGTALRAEILAASVAQRVQWAAGSLLDQQAGQGHVVIAQVNKAAKHYRVHPAAVEAQLRIWQR